METFIFIFCRILPECFQVKPGKMGNVYDTAHGLKVSFDLVFDIFQSAENQIVSMYFSVMHVAFLELRGS